MYSHVHVGGLILPSTAGVHVAGHGHEVHVDGDFCQPPPSFDNPRKHCSLSALLHLFSREGLCSLGFL